MLLREAIIKARLSQATVNIYNYSTLQPPIECVVRKREEWEKGVDVYMFMDVMGGGLIFDRFRRLGREAPT